MVAVYGLATFLGAALLFALEPFAARQVLPLFGGSPAVWNACVLFFQLGLLAGYVYAHVLSMLAVRAQRVVHLCVLAAAAAMPVGVRPEEAGVLGGGVWEVLWLLAQGVGVQFFAVASAGPLLQRWFSRTGAAAAHDPYFLYAASNAGSFVGLLAYPFVIERVWTLGEQAGWWRGGFVLFALLTAGAGLRARGQLGPAVDDIATPGESRAATEPPRAWRERAWWVFLSFVPASLLLSVTQYISTDLAAAPLLWVLPLALYLLTFVVAFSRVGERGTRTAARAWPLVAAAVVVAFLMDARAPIVPIAALHLAVLVTAGLLCHGRLRAARPPVARLTEFYLCVALGGALGGAFNSLLAPAVFDGLHEYPIGIALAALALPRAGRALRGWRVALWSAPAALTLWVSLSVRAAPVLAQAQEQVRLLISAGLPGLALYLTSRRRLIFALATLGVLGAWALTPRRSEVELRERTFFGIHSVARDAQGRFRVLAHGTTVHGLESLDPERRGEPLAYYSRQGPAGQVFRVLGDELERVAFIGLGAGSLAAYGEEGQRFDFFEIDPLVVRIASNPAWFSFVSGSSAETRVIVGDGRLRLALEPDGAYDMVVLDAFSSDAVPIHLLTLEAVEMYAAKLDADGLLLLHLSNRHLDLAPFAAAACARAGLTPALRVDLRTREDEAETGRLGSEWMIAAKRAETLAPLLRDVRWEPLSGAGRAWTDAHADVVSAIRRE